MDKQSIETVTVTAHSLGTETPTSSKEKVKTHFKQAKTKGKDRIQRIKSIFLAAFSEAVSEAKGGSQEMVSLSKESLVDLLELDLPTDTNEASQPFWKTVWASLQTKLKASLKREYDNLPQRYSTVKRNAAEWDEELSQKYGDRYTQTKQTLHTVARSSATKLAQWYRDNRAKAEQLETQSPTTPLEQKQAQVEVEAAVVGAKVAERERAVKQQIRDTIQASIGVDA